MAIIWFCIFILLLFIELITVNLVSIWFAIGALFSMLIALFVDNIWIQIIVFIIVSIVALIITKPLIKKFKIFDVTPTNSDRVIGMIGIVTKDIDKDNYGQIKVLGNSWTAASDESLKVNDKVKVIKIDGVKLIVKKEDE